MKRGRLGDECAELSWEREEGEMRSVTVAGDRMHSCGMEVQQGIEASDV